MKNLTSCSILFLFLFVQNLEAQKIQQFNWMIGVWQMEAKSGTIQEQWKIVNDTLLRGTNHLLKPDAKDSLLETIEIFYSKGQWNYQPTVQSQNEGKPITFKLIFIKEEEFIAENNAHDFPQRIAYRRIQTGLFATIEGWKNDAFSKINFDYYLP